MNSVLPLPLHQRRASTRTIPAPTVSNLSPFLDTDARLDSSPAMWQVTPVFDEEIGSLPSDRDFVAMLAAYRATGGLARGDDLARLLDDLLCSDFVSLGSLISAGEVFGFEWRHAFWVPMFQFDLRDLTLKSGPQSVLAELATEFDGWTLATWFAEPNSWLSDQRPVDLLDSNLPLVRQAARADRFIATG
jgi:hypothetical protein